MWLGYYFVTQGKQKHRQRGNSPRAYRHPQSHLNEAQMGTPQRKPSLMHRKGGNNVETMSKEGDEKPRVLFLLILFGGYTQTIRFRRNFKKTVFLSALLLSFSQNPHPAQRFLFKSLPKLILCSPWIIRLQRDQGLPWVLASYTLSPIHSVNAFHLLPMITHNKKLCFLWHMIGPIE